MTMLKKSLLSVTAVAVMTGIVGCGDDTVTAPTPQTHTITVTGGTATPAELLKDATFTLTATPGKDANDVDSVFVAWTSTNGGLDLLTGDATTTPTAGKMGKSDVAFKATYKMAGEVDPLPNVTLIKPTGGWSDIKGAGGAVTYDSTAGATDEYKAVATMTRPQKTATTEWPSAYITAGATTTNFEHLQGFIVEYKVDAITDGSSGVKMIISSTNETSGNFEIDRKEPTTEKWYGSFNAILTTGSESVGNVVTDTIYVDSDAFFLGYAGGSMADADVCAALDYTVTGTGEDAMAYLKDNLHVLGTTAGIAFGLEHNSETSADELNLSIISLSAFGGADMAVAE